MASPVALPPFETVIKSRDVEDPVNTWVHRPLAYGFVALFHRTSLTPNQITFIALVVGLSAGVCWLIGTPEFMVAGGALLWTSAILDGADGILARAKDMQSELGRAFDGLSDMIVAQATVLPAAYHIWITDQNPVHIPLMVVALFSSIAQVYTYDYYKEFYGNALNRHWNGRYRALAYVKAQAQRARDEGAPFHVRFAWNSYVTMLEGQLNIIKRLDRRAALRSEQQWPAGDDVAEIYKKHNYGPIRIWVMVSLCPHTYLIAICGMFDRLDLYMWFRGVVVNIVYIIGIIWQRRATTKTLADLEALGKLPTPLKLEDA